MKLYDTVKVINLNKKYTEKGIKLNDIGTIWQPEIIDNKFYVQFETNNNEDWYNYCDISIEDLELVEVGFGTDDMILEELRGHDPRWWCKVEDGYILNLKGEKKNKIPYDYNS